MQVRLEHMLQRLRALQDAAATARPTRLLPHLWVAGAVEANRHDQHHLVSEEPSDGHVVCKVVATRRAGLLLLWRQDTCMY